MPFQIESKVMIDLTQKGSRVAVNVAEVEEVDVRALDIGTWGGAVVEVKKYEEGAPVSFGSAVELKTATPNVSGVDVSGGVLALVLEVTTADANAGFGRVHTTGKENRYG